MSDATNSVDMDADADVSAQQSIDELNFTDLYLRIDEHGDSRYKIGPNRDGKQGNYPVPEHYIRQIEYIRTLIAKQESNTGALTMDTMRLRYARSICLDGEIWASVRRIPLEIPVLEGLFLNAEAVKIIQSWASRRGIVIIGGATGAGKTTTMVAALNEYMNRKSEIAVAIEDPPEFKLQGELGLGYCFQMEVNDDREWGEKVKMALRWRPKFIMIGEIRTPEAAAQALRASTSGHLVLATVHGGSVEETLGSVMRMAELNLADAARILLAENLVGVLHQKMGRFGPNVSILETSQKGRGADEVREALKAGRIQNIHMGFVKQYEAERG